MKVPERAFCLVDNPLTSNKPEVRLLKWRSWTHLPALCLSDRIRYWLNNIPIDFVGSCILFKEKIKNMNMKEYKRKITD